VGGRHLPCGAVGREVEDVSTVYGMNFDHMPELHWTLGYPSALILLRPLGCQRAWSCA